VLAVLFTAMGLRLLAPWLLGAFVDAAARGRPVSALSRIAMAYVAVALVAETLQLLVPSLDLLETLQHAAASDEKGAEDRPPPLDVHAGTALASGARHLRPARPWPCRTSC